VRLPCLATVPAAHRPRPAAGVPRRAAGRDPPRTRPPL